MILYELTRQPQSAPEGSQAAQQAEHTPQTTEQAT